MLRRDNLPLAVLLLAVCLTYANSLGNSFHFDDFHTVTDNPAVRSLGNLPRIFADATAFSVLPANQTYRPMVTASLALDYALAHGYGVFWFHLSTLLWFLLLVALIFFWAEGIFDSVDPVSAKGSHRWLALGTAAWFGLHPAMAETVNYVIQRGDLYCTLGCVAGLGLFARFPGGRRFGLYLLPFALAMLSKPPAAVFPLLLLLYVFFFEAHGRPPKERWGASLRAAAPSILLTLALLWLESRMTPKSYAPTILSSADYRLTQPFVWLRYTAALFLPLHLNVDTDLQPLHAFNAEVLAGLLFLAALLTAIVYSARRPGLYPIAYGLLWFALTQLPTSLYTLSEVENDHRMFFSFPGLMLAAVWALHLGLKRLTAARTQWQGWLPRATAAAAILALCGYAYGAHRRNLVWHDEASLWADDVAKSPRNGRGLMNFGLTRMNAGDFPGALALFSRALEYTPNYATLEINLGIVTGLLADSGQPDRAAEAEAHFERALALTPQDDLPHAYFGRWLLTHGRLAEATAQLQTAVTLDGQRALQRDLLLAAYARAGNRDAERSLAEATLAVIPGDPAALAALHGTLSVVAPPPSQAAALVNASLAAYRAGHFQQSIEQAQAALKLDPRSAEAWNNVGAGYGALRQWDLGIAAEQHALQLNPALAIAANNLRWFQSQRAGEGSAAPGSGNPGPKSAADYVNLSLTLNQAGRYRESIAAARQALTLDPQSAEAWNNIAAGEEAMGHWDDAIQAARQALAIRPDFTLARNNLAWSLGQKAAAKR